MPKAKFLTEFLNRAEGFDTILKGLKFLSAENGNCLASLILDKRHLNQMDSLHGGCSSTLIDVVTSYALLTHPKGERAHVSLDSYITFLKGASIGDEIFIKANTIRCGSATAHVNADIIDAKTSNLLVKGYHTKYFFEKEMVVVE